MTKHELAHPHDLLTRSILVDPELAASLLENYIESGIVELLDIKRLRCESPVDVDKNLVEIIGDLRYSTVFKNTEQESNVFVFLAHQSTRDDLMSFRALEEVVKAYRQYIDTAKQKGGQPKSFPFPLVVILYHGKRPWGKLKRMRDMIDNVAAFAGDVLDFPIFLIDLSRIPPEQLKGHPALQALLEALQLASEDKLEIGFDRVTSRLSAVRNDPRAAGWMKALVRYTISMCRIGQEIIYKSFLKILNEEEAKKMATSTMQEIEARGEVRTGRNMVLKALRTKFKKVPKEIEEAVLGKSDSIALESLLEQVFLCDTLDEFAEGL